VSDAWFERWMRAHVPEVPPGPVIAAARARVARYPAPMDQLWPRLGDALDRLAPLLCLGTLRRASQLDPARFDALEQSLSHHPNPAVRLPFLLARAPLYESMWPDVAPEEPTHPLDALQDHIRLSTRHGGDTFDVIVIGTGAGGAPVARELARAGLKVAIVESGGLLRAQSTHAAIERYYLDQGMLGSVAGGGTVLLMAGRALGGTTAVNSGTSLRPRHECLEEWDPIAGTDFADGGLEPYLDAVVADLGIEPTPEDLFDASARLVNVGLARLGRQGAYALPRNVRGCQGAARCCFGCPNGAKQSTDRAYLPGAVEAGAALFARTTATSIRADRDGVEVRAKTPEGLRRLRARHLVIAGGAIGTPQLIRDNRLGERWRIAGDHLGIHPATKAFGAMSEPLAHGGVPQALGYHDPTIPRLTLEGAHTPKAVTAPLMMAAGQRHRWWMDHHEYLANWGMMVRDRSRGTVRVARGHNLVTYRLHPEDAEDLGRGLLLVAEVLLAAGAERVLLPVFGRDNEVTSAQLATWSPRDFTAQNLMTSGFHPQGTAGMGRVVDADLGLIGAPHVSVCDASVMPASPGVNPQVTIMALSRRLAAHLTERLS
jgi:choline dehydrogenase-like flavoprotein